MTNDTNVSFNISRVNIPVSFALKTPESEHKVNTAMKWISQIEKDNFISRGSIGN